MLPTFFSDKIVSESARKNEMLWGECISGALLWSELGELCEEYGLSDPLLVEASPITIKPELKALLGSCQFTSVTYRIFKPPTLSTGKKHAVTYLGGINELPDQFLLSSDFIFKTGKSVNVPVAMSDDLITSRYSKSLKFDAASCVPRSRKPLNPFSADVKLKNSADCCPSTGCC